MINEQHIVYECSQSDKKKKKHSCLIIYMIQITKVP